MTYYEEDAIRRGIARCLADPNPEERLMMLLRDVTAECYNAGKIKVQTDIITALDLRHFLG